MTTPTPTETPTETQTYISGLKFRTHNINNIVLQVKNNLKPPSLKFLKQKHRYRIRSLYNFNPPFTGMDEDVYDLSHD